MPRSRAALPRAALRAGAPPPWQGDPHQGPKTRQRPIWGQHGASGLRGLTPGSGHRGAGPLRPARAAPAASRKWIMVLRTRVRLRWPARNAGARSGPENRGRGVGPGGKGTGVRGNGHRYPWERTGGVRTMGRTIARGYGYAHRQLRAWWAPRVATGLVQCWRCGVVIRADESWHLGHADGNRHVHKGPEHVDCNCRTNARERRVSDPSPHVDRWWDE